MVKQENLAEQQRQYLPETPLDTSLMRLPKPNFFGVLKI